LLVRISDESSSSSPGARPQRRRRVRDPEPVAIGEVAG
jgi:hypothetical protein